MSALAFLVGSCKRDQINTSVDPFQYQVISVGIGWVPLVRLPCLYASVNCTASFHVVRAMGCLFVKLIQLRKWKTLKCGN